MSKEISVTSIDYQSAMRKYLKTVEIHLNYLTESLKEKMDLEKQNFEGDNQQLTSVVY